MLPPFRVSLSAYQAYQTCEQRYKYAYVDRLRTKLRDIAPERGTVFHEYLQAYYSGLKDDLKPSAAHKRGLAAILMHRQEFIAAASTAFTLGNESLAADYDELSDSLLSMADRYYRNRGYPDSKIYDVVLVEFSLVAPLAAGIVSDSVIDLVLRDRTSGVVWLVEHKTTKSVPESGLRIRDFQTVLYTKVLELTQGIHVDGILWNYIRTKDPTVPVLLKAGGVSRNKACDTTWEVYERTVQSAGLNPDDYEDMHEHLADRELTVFFPRFEHIIVTRPEILLEDYAITAQEMRRKRSDWERGVSNPVRTLSRNCSFCPYYRICEAAIVGGDESDVIRMNFTSKKEGSNAPRITDDGGTTGPKSAHSTNESSWTPRFVQAR